MTNGSIGILALQGDVALHRESLQKLNVEPVLVTMPEHLQELTGLIIPGGESTTLLKLAKPIGILEAIKDFMAAGHNVYGTCAGAILIATKVTNPSQESLKLIDITVERNGYGRQLDSADTTGTLLPPLGKRSFPMVFIRAPKIISVGKAVTVLATYKGDPVLVQQGKVLAGTFHPELNENLDIYKYWLKCL
jgi:pyridoxal 5'-phosphate synthase pdxT subunit